MPRARFFERGDIMFREMRRIRQQIPHEEAVGILERGKTGVLAVNGDDGFPYAVPMDFLFDAAKKAIYLHSATEGHKVDAIERDGKVCFTTWTKGIQKEGDWSFFVDSVIAFGHAVFVEDDSERLEATKQLGLKYYPTEEEVDKEIERDLGRMLLIRVDIDHMSGKHVHER